MGPFVLLHVALVGFFGCAALYSAWTWWHTRADRTLILFAVQCLLSVVLSANFECFVERPGLRVLYMSGYTDDALVQHVVLNTDASYLQKPFDAEPLSRKVRQAFEVIPPSPN